MTVKATLFDHVDADRLHRLPAQYRQTLKRVEVELPDDGISTLRFRPTAIGDWWFGWIESRGVLRIRATDSTPTHDHAILMLSSGGQIRALNATLPHVAPGHISLSPGAQTFGLFSTGELRCLVVHIPLTCLEQAVPARPPRLGLTLSAYAGPGAILAAALRALASEGNRAQDNNSLLGLLPGIAQMIRQTFDQPVEPIVRHDAHDRLERVREYLEAHFPDPALTSRTVSRACGVSERQLYRDFATGGESFGDTLRRLRLEKAAIHLVAGPSVLVTEVGYSCGFQNPSSFTRSFHNSYGLSPRAYRKLHLSVDRWPSIERH